MNAQRSDQDFEPEITAFYCIYCGYMAADTAGVIDDEAELHTCSARSVQSVSVRLRPMMPSTVARARW